MRSVFSLSGDGAALGMAVTLADRQHSGYDPRRMSLRKIKLSFGAIITLTISRNRGNTSKVSIPHMCKAQEADAGGQEFERPKNCT